MIDATALSSTQWLDGLVWLKTDAANADSLAIPIHVLVSADVEPVVWDTVQSHTYMFDPFFDPEGECVALAVSNHGEIGNLGGGSVNLDYKESGLECGTRDEDAIYLKSGSPFVIMADNSAGANARLTCSYNDASQVDVTGWDPTPAKGSTTGGVNSSDAYDSVYTGQFVNRDTTIAMERIYYAPRPSTPLWASRNFVVDYTKVYSADGQAHGHVTIGNAVDWDVPSDRIGHNNSNVSVPGGFVYIQGTDTAGHTGCQSHTNRLAAEDFGGYFTSAELDTNPCANHGAFYGCVALPASLLADTTHYRDGTPLIPS
ncbi:MAG: hypothetical protein AB1772_09900 [Candidatus Zixiibacteriota bacterium]